MVYSLAKKVGVISHRTMILLFENTFLIIRYSLFTSKKSAHLLKCALRIEAFFLMWKKSVLR